MTETRRAPRQGESLAAAYRVAAERRDADEIERLDAVPRKPKDADRG
jgi:hypothetical protein